MVIIDKRLTKLREEIDAIDDALARAILSRILISRIAVEYKREIKLPPVDLKREKEVIDRVVKITNGEVSRQSFETIYETIFSEGKRCS